MANSVEIAKVLVAPNCKVMRISGGAGDVMEKHQVSESATILVKKGAITYKQEGLSDLLLKEGEGHSVPPNVLHEVRCNNDAEIFLIVPTRGVIKYDS